MLIAALKAIPGVTCVYYGIVYPPKCSIEYIVERRCDLQKVGGLLDSKGYGIALPKGMN